MPKLALTGGSYQARSVIASAQRALNLLNEPIPQAQGEPAQYASYPTPGLRSLSTLPQGPVRGIRQATNGNIYAVAGSGVYSLNPSTWAGTLLGSITPGLTTPVSMQDNTLTMVIVDGTAGGWQINLASNAFSAISDPTGMFAGADAVGYVDTYLLFNKPGTPQFYSSNSLAVAFDPTWFANKSSYSDLLVTLAVAKREIWLIGQRTTEIWYNAGSPDFPFGQIPSTFVDHGTLAKYSVAVYDNSVFWLTQDRQGFAYVMQGAGYQTKRVSTFAIEQAITDYVLSDAVGFTYLLDGHACYVLAFPTSDHTWVLDISTGLWHEWAWTDSNGNQHRHRANCGAAIASFGYVVGDWQNGNLYALDHNVYTDAGAPILRQRSFPHVLNNGTRVFFSGFIADIETGTGGGTAFPSKLGRCFFTAPDGTLVENYVPNAGDSAASWSVLAGAAQITGNQVVATANAGTAWYQYSLSIPTPDYAVTAKLPLTALINGSAMLVVGRSTGQGAGYQAGVLVAGGLSYLVLRYGPTDVRLFAGITSDALYVTLTMVGTTISVAAQRSSDGYYLNQNGAWTRSSLVPAISATDGTYTAAGRIAFSANWPPTGPMQLEDATGWWSLEDSSGYWEWDEVADSAVALDTLSAVTASIPYSLLLDWSDDRGHTYGTPVPQQLGGLGEYVTSVQWQRLGYSRDRVWRLSWSAPVRTALQGAWIEAEPGYS